MAWEILLDEDFEAWLRSLSAEVADAIAADVIVLATFGPQLGRPKVDSVKGSAFGNMKELRVSAGKAPYRVLFAFDPKRRAILLLGGHKEGQALLQGQRPDRRRAVPQAPRSRRR